MLKVEDATLIYHTKRYYRDRVNKLIDKGYVKRYKSYIILDKNGRPQPAPFPSMVCIWRNN